MNMMIRYFIFCLLVFLLTQANAQEMPLECGTMSNNSWVDILQKKVKARNYLNDHRTSQLDLIPFQIHLVVKSDGTSGLTVQQVRNEIDSVNSFYANANMFFYECQSPEIIYDDSLYDFEYNNEESILLSQHYTNDIINLYFANTTRINGTLVCGYSRFPPSQDYAVIETACATNGSTLAHELGHYFGLFHTHGDISQGELVDGSNCAFDGDMICDTPADPTLGSSNVNSSCVYTGTSVDANFIPYTPDVSNIMSYSRKHCRNKFSPDQYNVIYNTMQVERGYLFCPSVTGTESYSRSNYKLYPNPGTSRLSIEMEDAYAVEVKIFNLLGACVFMNTFSNKLDIDAMNFMPGIYFYLLTTKNHSYSGKWMKSE
jgi:hypothetical protein